MRSQTYRKHFIPLESNAKVFTDLVHRLGVSSCLRFQDVYSLDEDFLPHPAIALILIFPTSDSYEAAKATDEALREHYSGSGPDEDVIWFKQTINNACGLYAILHAVCNGDAVRFIQPKTILGDLLEACTPLNPDSRAQVLEDSELLESVYRSAALQGDTEAPLNAEDEVDFHFVCFARSKSGVLYELDGDRKGPVPTNVVMKDDEDVLCKAGVRLIRRFMEKEGESGSFGLMALVEKFAGQYSAPD